VASAAAISEQQVGGPETEPGRDTILKNNKVKGVYRAPGWNCYRPWVCPGGDDLLFTRLRSCVNKTARVPDPHACICPAIPGRTRRQVTAW